MRFKKRGLSPIIATMILISLALVLAVIIFFWARSFIGESVEKQGQKIDLLCNEVSFRAEAYGSPIILYVENLGNVPLNGVEVKKKSLGGDVVKTEGGAGETIAPGQTAQFNDLSEVIDGEIIIVNPVLLGETSSQKKSYACDDEFGIEIVVGG